jgi:hypothetical protein
MCSRASSAFGGQAALNSSPKYMVEHAAGLSALMMLLNGARPCSREPTAMIRAWAGGCAGAESEDVSHFVIANTPKHPAAQPPSPCWWR